MIWSSKRQSTVVQSSTEAEFIAADSAATHIAWFRTFLADLGYNIDKPQTLGGQSIDNQSTIKMLWNPQFHHHQEHIDVKHKYIREKHDDGTFRVKHVSADNQMADFLKKALAPSNFHHFIISIHMS